MALPLKQIGPFQGQEPLVPGAEMGVYRVTDTRTQHDCVLYVLDLHLQHDPVLLQRFRQTAHQTSPLRHEHLVPIVETGEAAHYAYAATGPLSGITLADYLQRHTNPLTIAEAIDLVQQIAAGLDAGHQQGLLHLALTPSEIWMSTEGQVQVMGLGVPRPARPVGEQAATDAESAGVAPAPSPFLAPEQARGAEQIDQRADVYSLGAIAYLLLVGQPPIQTDDPLLLARQIVYQSPTPPESLRPDLPPGMVSVLKFVLTKDPNLRYGGAGEFAGALLQAQRWQAGVPVTATPGQPPWRQQALDAVRLWPAHRRLLVASLLLILLLVALLLAWRPFGRVLSEQTAAVDNQPGGQGTLVETPTLTTQPETERAVAVAPGRGSQAGTASVQPTAGELATGIAASMTATTAIVTSVSGVLTATPTMMTGGPQSGETSPAIVALTAATSLAVATATNPSIPTAADAEPSRSTATATPLPTATATRRSTATRRPTNTPTAMATNLPPAAEGQIIRPIDTATPVFALLLTPPATPAMTNAAPWTAATRQVYTVYLSLVMGAMPLEATVRRDANLRAGPGTNFPIVGVTRAGESVALVACSQDCVWYRMANGNWIAAFLVQTTADPQQTLPREIPTPSGE